VESKEGEEGTSSRPFIEKKGGREGGEKENLFLSAEEGEERESASHPPSSRPEKGVVRKEEGR